MSNTPDISSVLQSIKIGDFQIPIFSLVVTIIIAFFFIWIRTNSLYSILTTLWKIIHGSSENPDGEIGRYFEYELSLIKFRFISGIKVRTKKQAEELINWSIEKNESLQDIAKIKKYFDLENLCLAEEKRPKRKQLVFTAITFFILMLAIVPTMQGIKSERVLLQFKESGKFFLATPEESVNIHGDLIIKKSDCKLPIQPSTFTKDEKIAICMIFENNSKAKSFLDDSIKAQRLILAVILFTIILLASLLMNEIRAIAKFNEIRERIEKTK